jgi:hypothetical protein
MYNLKTGVKIAVVNGEDWLEKTMHLYCPANNPKKVKDAQGNARIIEDKSCLRKPKDVKIRHGYSKTLTGRPHLTDFASTQGNMGLMSPTDAGFSMLDMHEKQLGRGGAYSTTN